MKKKLTKSLLFTALICIFTVAAAFADDEAGLVVTAFVESGILIQSGDLQPINIQSFDLNNWCDGSRAGFDLTYDAGDYGARFGLAFNKLEYAFTSGWSGLSFKPRSTDAWIYFGPDRLVKIEVGIVDDNNFHSEVNWDCSWNAVQYDLCPGLDVNINPLPGLILGYYLPVPMVQSSKIKNYFMLSQFAAKYTMEGVFEVVGGYKLNNNYSYLGKTNFGTLWLGATINMIPSCWIKADVEMFNIGLGGLTGDAASQGHGYFYSYPLNNYLIYDEIDKLKFNHYGFNQFWQQIGYNFGPFSVYATALELIGVSLISASIVPGIDVPLINGIKATLRFALETNTDIAVYNNVPAWAIEPQITIPAGKVTLVSGFDVYRGNNAVELFHGVQPNGGPSGWSNQIPVSSISSIGFDFFLSYVASF
jgi:hypothetical protein